MWGKAWSRWWILKLYINSFYLRFLFLPVLLNFPDTGRTYKKGETLKKEFVTMSSSQYDESKKQVKDVLEPASDVSIGEVDTGEVLRPVKQSGSILATLRFWEEWLDWKMGVEPHGPERITPDKRRPVPICEWLSNKKVKIAITSSLHPSFRYSLRYLNCSQNIA